MKHPEKKGFIFEPLKETDYIFGDNKLGDAPIQEDANWSGYLPDIEVQNLNGIEPLACVSFTILSIVEILERKLYGATSNWSDRFLAAISGTKEKKGNSPGTVAEILKDRGVVAEHYWPFDAQINSYEKFYADIPKNIETLALAFRAEYSFGYSHVPSNYDSLMRALQYSPIGFSVYAWVKNADGLYYRPAGGIDGHFTVCYGYVKNNYWLIFDSYGENGEHLKKVKWDSLPQQAKRFTLNRQIVIQSWFDKFIAQLKAILGL